MSKVKSGTIVDKRYRIGDEIGQGGMGTVYRAFDETLERDVALKILSQEKLGTDSRALLVDEAQLVAQLNHPNIVTVFDAGEYESFPFIIMELVEGQTLYDEPPQDFEDIVSVAQQICTALIHAHTRDIVHRDLKPENILLDSDGNIRLMDFGLARSVSSRLTSEGTVVGTVYYMSPEQAMGQELDARADLYSLGVVLYELVTGQLPFSDKDPIAVISQHLHAPVVAPRAKRSDLPPMLNDLILRLLRKEPEERPNSASDVLKLLNDPAIIDAKAAPIEKRSLLERIVRGRIVGRKEEFEEARALWRKAESGQGQLLLISGEPGVGKTRLMREIATHAEVSGGRALIGESFAEGNPPYGAFGQIVRKALKPGSSNGIELTDFILADLLTIAPELRQHYPNIPSNPSLEPAAERQRLFENFTNFGATLSEKAPLLMVIDDAHWSDSGTLFLLRYLTRRTKNMPIMLIATYREVELAESRPLNEMLLELNRQRLGTRLKLSRLDLEKTRHLLEAILAENVSEEFSKVVYRETEGNPFYVEEVCKALVESGILYYEDGDWQGPDLDQIEIPQSLQVAIEARLAKLDEEIINVLRVAATLGREFEYETLVKASKESENHLVGALEAAEDAQMLSEVSGKAGGVFSFAHALIPTALISGLSGLRRRRLHRQALAAEEELHPEDFASLAHHAAESGEFEKTAEYGQKAGDAASVLFAWEEAQFQYGRAIEAAEELDQHERLSQLYELSAKAYFSQGLNTMAIKNYKKAQEFSHDKTREAELKSFLGAVYVFIGDERGIALLEEARQGLNPKTQALPLANSFLGIGRHHHLQSHYQKALNAFQEAQKISDKLDNPSLQGSIFTMKAGAYQQLAQYEESNKWAHSTITLGQQKNAPAFVAVGFEYLAENAWGTGRWKDAIKFANKDIEIGKKIGDQNRLAWGHLVLAVGHHGLGELAKADHFARHIFDLTKLSGDTRLESLSSSWYAIILCDLGRYKDAKEFGLNAVMLSEKLGLKLVNGISKSFLAYYYNQREDWQQALELLDSAEKINTERTENAQLPIFIKSSQAEAHWGLGKLDKAQRLAKESFQSAVKFDIIHLQANTQRILAQIHYSKEEYGDALEKANSAIKVAKKEDYRLGLGRAFLWKAKILAAKRENEAAKEAISQAIQLFETCGARPELERAQVLRKGIN